MTDGADDTVTASKGGSDSVNVLTMTGEGNIGQRQRQVELDRVSLAQELK